MKRKQSLCLMAVVAVMLFTTACSSSSSYNMAGSSAMSSGAAYGSEYQTYESEDMSLAGSAGSLRLTDPNRKIITTIEMSLETTQFDTYLAQLQDELAATGGYIESSYVQGRSGTRGRSASITVRIPQENLYSFVDTLEANGNVLYRREDSHDVTLEYTDSESHKAALNVEYERLLELMERAETVEDMILLEERLSSIRYQLEYYESQLRTYDNQVSYSTVYIDISEVVVLTEVDDPGVFQRISSGLAHTFRSIGTFFIELFIWIVVNFVYILILAAVLIIAVIRYRRSAPKRKAKAEARAAKFPVYPAGYPPQGPGGQPVYSPAPDTQPQPAPPSPPVQGDMSSDKDK